MSDSNTKEFLADLDNAQKTVEKLQQSNLSKVQALAQMGKGIDIAILANLKMDLFAEMFLDEQAKLVYLHNLETRLKVMLDEALAQTRQEQLTEGVKNKPGLILPR